MKDKEKQIEEMAKEIESAKRDIWASVTTRKEDEDYLWHSRRIAEHLTSLDYQKVDKDSVVLSREEYDNLKLEIQKAHNKGIRVGFDLTKYKENSIERARKETAREILQRGKYCMPSGLREWIEQQYGVEVDNGR
jgi:hypothetical protein